MASDGLSALTLLAFQNLAQAPYDTGAYLGT